MSINLYQGGEVLGAPTKNYSPPQAAAPPHPHPAPKATVTYRPGSSQAKAAAAKKSGSSGSKTVVPKYTPPPMKSIEDWLAGDTTYGQQLAQYNASEQAQRQNYNNQTNQVNQNFDATQRAMNRQADEDRQNQQYDFAGRGVLTSGVFAKALGDYNTNFQDQLNNLIMSKNQQLATADTDLNNFLRQLQLSKDQARQNAIDRRSQAYGI